MNSLGKKVQIVSENDKVNAQEAIERFKAFSAINIDLDKEINLILQNINAHKSTLGNKAEQALKVASMLRPPNNVTILTAKTVQR